MTDELANQYVIIIIISSTSTTLQLLVHDSLYYIMYIYTAFPLIL